MKFCEDKYPFEEVRPDNEEKLSQESGWTQPHMIDDSRQVDPLATQTNEEQEEFGPADTPKPSPVHRLGSHEDRGSPALALTESHEIGPSHIEGAKVAHIELPTSDLNHDAHGLSMPQPNDELGPNTLRSSQSRRPPAHLHDYIC